jgi:hypothetical protein
VLRQVDQRQIAHAKETDQQQQSQRAFERAQRRLRTACHPQRLPAIA